MRAAAAWLGVLCLSLAPAAAQAPYPFQNPNLPIEERVTNITSLLTPEEKNEARWRPRSSAACRATTPSTI